MNKMIFKETKKVLISFVMFLLLVTLTFPARAGAVPAPGDILNPIKQGVTPLNSWNFSSTKFYASGNYIDDDLAAEIATIYDYGNNDMGIITINPYNLFSWKTMYRSGAGNWSLSNTKFVTSGDYNGDNLSDVAAIYDYGNNNMGIWVFSSDGSDFSPNKMYLSGVGNWSLSRTKYVLSGYFDPDPLADIAMVYDYGNGKMGIWVFSSTPGGFVPSKQYISTNGMYNFSKIKAFVSGDFYTDSISDLALIYDLANDQIAVFVFSKMNPVSFTRNTWYKSPQGAFKVPNIKYVTSTKMGNVSFLYDYGNNTAGIFDFYRSNDYQFSLAKYYQSGANGWSSNNTKAFLGDYFYSDLSPYGTAAIYDYGNRLGLWNFTYPMLPS